MYILKYEEIIWGYSWLNLTFTDQSGLFHGLSDMHRTSVLASRRGVAFESQKEVPMFQAPKVKLSDHCGCDCRCIPAVLSLYV